MKNIRFNDEDAPTGSVRKGGSSVVHEDTLSAEQAVIVALLIQQEEEAPYILQAKQGKAEAWNYLYPKNFPFIKKCVWRHLSQCVSLARAQGLFEDCIQNTFIFAWLHIHKYSPQVGKPFRVWLCSIAYYMCRNALKAEKRDTDLFDRLVTRQDPGKEDSDVLKLLVDFADVQEQVHIIRGLKAQEQQIIELYYLGGLSHEAIGQQINKTAHAVKQTFYRIRKKIRQARDDLLKSEGS